VKTGLCRRCGESHDGECERNFSERLFDTAQLGAIRFDPNSNAEKARVVREAMYNMAEGLNNSIAWHSLASYASDADLIKFKALLK
jgi:hypothetical protein